MVILLEGFLNSLSAFSKNSKTRCVINCKVDPYKTTLAERHTVFMFLFL